MFRNGSQDENLDKKTRLHLLELIELRAKHWQGSDYMSQYYRHRGTHAEVTLLILIFTKLCMEPLSFNRSETTGHI